MLKRRLGVLLACALVTVLGLTAYRLTLLRFAGRVLIGDDPIAPADAIVVAIDADGAGVLEAADLVQSGIATRVAVFADPPDAVSLEFRRRGGWYEDDAARADRELKALGVQSVERIPIAVSGTEDEGVVLPGWCRQRDYRSIVVVTSADHSRRLRRVLRRAMSNLPTTVMVRSARRSRFDPDRWWERSADVRTGIVELQKLLLDVVRHPAS